MTDLEHNSPDLAIALQYDGRNAPRISAKGSGELAQRMLSLAEEHQVPLHEDPELAALLSQIPLGDEIPEALYRAVAEVIAFAYLLSGKFPPGFEIDDVEKDTP
jgi:flagellar biosynthesis protein